jgi:hypothetical protein
MWWLNSTESDLTSSVPSKYISTLPHVVTPESLSVRGNADAYNRLRNVDDLRLFFWKVFVPSQQNTTMIQALKKLSPLDESTATIRSFLIFSDLAPNFLSSVQNFKKRLRWYSSLPTSMRTKTNKRSVSIPPTRQQVRSLRVGIKKILEAYDGFHSIDGTAVNLKENSAYQINYTTFHQNVDNGASSQPFRQVSPGASPSSTPAGSPSKSPGRPGSPEWPYSPAVERGYRRTSFANIPGSSFQDAAKREYGSMPTVSEVRKSILSELPTDIYMDANTRYSLASALEGAQDNAIAIHQNKALNNQYDDLQRNKQQIDQDDMVRQIRRMSHGSLSRDQSRITRETAPRVTASPTLDEHSPRKAESPEVFSPLSPPPTEFALPAEGYVCTNPYSKESGTTQDRTKSCQQVKEYLRDRQLDSVPEGVEVYGNRQQCTEKCISYKKGETVYKDGKVHTATLNENLGAAELTEIKCALMGAGGIKSDCIDSMDDVLKSSSNYERLAACNRDHYACKNCIREYGPKKGCPLCKEYDSRKAESTGMNTGTTATKAKTALEEVLKNVHTCIIDLKLSNNIDSVRAAFLNEKTDKVWKSLLFPSLNYSPLEDETLSLFKNKLNAYFKIIIEEETHNRTNKEWNCLMISSVDLGRAVKNSNFESIISNVDDIRGIVVSFPIIHSITLVSRTKTLHLTERNTREITFACDTKNVFRALLLALLYQMETASHRSGDYEYYLMCRVPPESETHLNGTIVCMLQSVGFLSTFSANAIGMGCPNIITTNNPYRVEGIPDSNIMYLKCESKIQNVRRELFLLADEIKRDEKI